MANAGAKLRAVAAETVDAVVNDGQSLDAAFEKCQERLAASDRPVYRLLVYGALRNHWQLQNMVDRLLQKPLKKRDRVINALLAIGIVQLTDTRVPDHAVVSQTVEAARQLRRPKLAGLVNACLRKFVRENMATVTPTTKAARWNHPDWLIERIRCDWPDDWQSILEANNERAPMWLRANPSRNTAAAYCDRLAGANIAAEQLAAIPGAVRLRNPQAVDALPGFRDGDASVQDAAAQIAARWLLHERRGRLLDACAAPGGKSGHLLELGGDEVTLLTVDNDAARNVAIRENLDRIGRDATIVAADASKPEEWWDGEPFDGILLDAPCSASGVIRRHPDIKLLRRASDIGTLATAQAGLLNALWPLLVPGGRLLYVTCSVIAAENDEVVGRFLDDHQDALENDVLPNNNIRDLMRRKACGYQVLPGTADLDGFYYACLEKQTGSAVIDP